MRAIAYRLRLLEPVLVSQAESGEENSAIGLSFIPGSAIRGALAARYLQAFEITDPAADGLFRHLFLDGSVCFLNAYPWREGARSLPRPLSWMAEKDKADEKEGTAYDWAIDPESELERPKAVDGQFCVLVDDTAYMTSPSRQVNVHISLQDVDRRGDENTVYRYDALAAGEILAGAVVSNDGDLLELVKTLLDTDEIAVGAAHRAGYGRVRIEDMNLSQNGWNEYTLGDGSDTGEIVVTLLSDAIVRGNDGQVNGDISAALAAILRLPYPKPARCYQSLHLVGGYNRKWNLPLPQTWAIQAGSAFVFPADSFAPNELRRLTELGIGERRAEGFGRLAVNWQRHAELNWEKADPPEIARTELSEESKTLALQMANRRLRLLLDQRLVAAVNRIQISAPLPQNSQLSRVRSAAQQAMVEGNFNGLQRHLANLKGARDQFEKARLDNTPMDRWIEERAKNLDVEVQLQLGQPPLLPEVAGQKAQLTTELKVEYTARLIDGVMKKAAKLNQKQEEGS